MKGTATTVERELPNDEAEDLIAMVRDLADAELVPVAAEHERPETFPRELFRVLGKTGLLGLPFAEDVGGGGQPHVVHLQVVEELAMRLATVALGVSMHTLTSFPVDQYGSAKQRAELLPTMAGGDLLGGYGLSEAHAGSDPGAMRARARAESDGTWTASGAKAWVTHGGHADYCSTLLRTGAGPSGISCFHITQDLPGLSASALEQTVGLTGSTTIHLAELPLAQDRLIGVQSQGLSISLAALDAGRLGVSAIAVGLAQSALDVALRYAMDRETFGKPIVEHQGLAFLLADMAAAVESAPATYLHSARLKDRGRPCSRQASVAKLITTDAAMRVTTDAVQVLGGAGYTRGFPAERTCARRRCSRLLGDRPDPEARHQPSSRPAGRRARASHPTRQTGGATGPTQHSARPSHPVLHRSRGAQPPDEGLLMTTSTETANRIDGADSGQITTSDGVGIRYLEAGSGPDLLLVPGWSQTAAQWRKQIEDFSRDHHVVAVDMRGHGDSDKPAHGYRIARLAADLHELVTQLDLRDIHWIAHSMGCSITWSYWDLFGGDRIAKLVLVDQPAVLVADPAWDEGDKDRMSAVFDYATVSALSAGLRGADAQAVTESLIGGMFTSSAAPEEIAWAVERNVALPRAQAGTLLIDHCYQDWRDLLPRIDVPTLVIGGAVSLFPPAGIEWVAQQIPDAEVRIFSEQERGCHFMFWENAELFNTVVRDFLG